MAAATATATATAGSASLAADADIEPYRLHVSQRWLDLTQRKLELARVPREPPGYTVSQHMARGVPKDELVTLLDYWLEDYDHRVQEERYNERLPQYRTSLALTGKADATYDLKISNLHFVHRRSSNNHAIPLLFCHDWGGSFAEIARVIEGLCEPITTPTPHRPTEQAFHVVSPSIPGFGFSDASPDADFGLEGTADVLDALMKKLGYSRYLLHGSRWGFLVCRTIALRNPASCIALHTAGLEVPRPKFWHAPIAWLSHHLARITRARSDLLSFGYVPSDFEVVAASPKSDSQIYHSPLEALAVPSHTLDYALSDSPAGLLALMLDTIRYADHSHTRDTNSNPVSLVIGPWSPADVVFWTMLYWLPGPEAPIRWLRSVSRQCVDTAPLWRTYSQVPLGVSHYRENSLPAWASAHQNLCWVRRRTKKVCRSVWETPEDLVMDLRSFTEEMLIRTCTDYNKA